MKYTKFTIKNYKGIEKIEIDLTKLPKANIFTFVGLNESGKTSILEAINLLHNNINRDHAHEMIHKSKKGNFNGSISVLATLELDAEDEKEIKKFCNEKNNGERRFILAQDVGQIIYTKEYKFKNSKCEEESPSSTWNINLLGKKERAKKDSRLYDKDRDKWIKVIKKIKENLFPKIVYYENFLFDFPQKIYLEKYEGESIEQEEYRAVLQDILNSVDNTLIVNDHILNRLESSESEDKEALDALLGQVSEKLTNKIFKSWEEIFEKSNKQIELITGQDNKGYYIELKIKQGADRYYIRERSLGFRWFFSFLIFTEFRKERADDKGETLFLLDEPASNLHQYSQKKLLNLFEKLTDKCKLIYSTHSHHLINPKFLSGTYIIKNEAINYKNDEAFNQSKTDIKAILYKNFVAGYPDEKDYFQPILDSIHYCPSDLEQIPNIVCTEGKNDYYTFKYIQNKFFKNKFDLNFYPGAGVSKYDELFRLYLSWNKKFIAIFDADNQGRKEQKRYINDIGIELEKKIFILQDIDKKFDNLKTEDLFTDSEQIKIIQNLFPEHKKETGFNKSKFNTAIQDLFINNRDFKLNDGTLKKFEKIFQFVSKKFS
ncbi:AAA family ATPase [Candidatus Parcubacteria bacterium]|nr:AAA family ATPase [Candidatus Parcubacteria bacterium]